ncbi:MAG: cytochrome c3 family protein [Gemmatimonadota bacterium]|nr:cytochrome c3 family protein [Gemmatimonadota bacterium]
MLTKNVGKMIAGLVAVFTLTGCGDGVMYVDRALFNPPADAVHGFLGYYDQADKKTACGNCHVGIQADWETTKHAVAYDGLVSSGYAQDYCYGCHTVNDLGNPISEPAGWNAVQDTLYHDVQCESCHGPGLEHVNNPDATQPLASIDVSYTVDAATSCAECHQGSHHPFAEEWSQSAHATPIAYVTGRSDPSSCIGCHTAQGALKAWGEADAYVEATLAAPDHEGITCAVCHDPHGSENTAQLRFPIDEPNAQTNLCMKCHHKRAEPEVDASTLRGPHSPEGPLLLGEGAGWFPPGFTPQTNRIFGSHGSTGNPGTCATCHVSGYTATDAETGAFVFSATGHLFLAIPCVDAQGIPTTNQTCTLPERQFESGCTGAGCHATGDVARNAYTTATTRIANLVADVDALLALPAVAPEFNRFDGIFTVADGAWFNARLGELPGTAIHNPFLAEQLLVASIQAIKDTYGVTVPAPLASLELEL